MSNLERAYKLMLTEYPDVLSVKQVAEILDCDYKQVYKMIDFGYFYATKPGRRYKIAKYSLIGYLIGEKSA